MFATLYAKEIQNSLRTIRLVIAMAAILLSFAVSGIVSSASYHNQRAEYEQRKAAQARALSARMEALNEAAFHRQQVLLPPTRYPYIRDLSSTSLPEMIPVSVVGHGDMQMVRRSNPLLYAPDAFSWQFIMVAIGGFVAILLSYDAVAGERRRGTISLAFSNSLPRWKFLTAKILALVTINAVLISVGLLLSLLILSLGGVPVLNVEAVITAAVFLLLAILYISFITVLGALVSCCTRIPSLSLTALFFVWIIIALVIPSSARIVAGVGKTLPTPEERSRERSAVINDIISEGDKTRPSVNGSTVVSLDRFPFTAVEWHVANYLIDVHSAERRLQEAFEQRLFSQAELGLGLARWSPVELFGEAIAGLTDTDIDRWRRFINSVEKYRGSLGEAVKSLDAADPNSPHVYFTDLWTNGWISRRPVDDATLIPRFSISDLPLGDRIAAALSPAAAICLWILVFYLLAVVVFLRIDLRQQQS